jgi:hypothetical protein
MQASSIRSPPGADEPLASALGRLFAGPREGKLSLGEFLAGLQGRAYPFAIAAINLPNCIPTGIPWLSTITGVPICLLLLQEAMGTPIPSLPRAVARGALSRGRLQDFHRSVGPWLARIERQLRPRHRWLIEGTAGLLAFLALVLNAVVLALPIPLDNLLPAWAIMFFCIARMEGDGIAAAVGWVMTIATILWTIGLLFLYSQLTAIALELLQQLRILLFG